MKTTFKRLGSALLALALLIALAPATALPAKAEEEKNLVYNGLKYEVTYPDNVSITGYTKDLPAKVIIPESIEGKPVTRIGNGAFTGCASLTNITIPASVTAISFGSKDGIDVFEGCTSLTEINVASGNTKYTSQDGVLFNRDKTILLRYPEGKSSSYHIPKGVTEIDNYAFYKNATLTDIFIPEGVTEIGCYSFLGCSNLTSVRLPSSMKRICGVCFNGCTNLTSITLPSCLEEICSEPNEYYYFVKCPKLAVFEVYEVAGATRNYSSLDGVLFNGNKTVLVAFPNGKGENYVIPDGVTGFNGSAFSYDLGLKSIVIPNSVTSIERSCLWMCSNLTDIYYTGTEAQWKAIESSRQIPDRMTVHFNYKPVENPFTDVKESAYYCQPVLWAVENGITSGVDATHFAPGQGCTRAQVATFLWRSAGCPEPKNAASFVDVPDSKYYAKAVAWAVENGITYGVSDDHFNPNDVCTRGQIVTFLWRSAGCPEPQSSNNPFSDVYAGSYYAQAVLWAAENGIAYGTGSTAFSPRDTCTRGQVVTFLFRFAS